MTIKETKDIKMENNNFEFGRNIEIELSKEMVEELKYQQSRCKYCGLPMFEHEGDGFCPGGTEEFGGRR